MVGRRGSTVLSILQIAVIEDNWPSSTVSSSCTRPYDRGRLLSAHSSRRGGDPRGSAVRPKAVIRTAIRNPRCTHNFVYVVARIVQVPLSGQAYGEFQLRGYAVS